MLDYAKMAETTTRRKAALQSKIAATRESLEAMEKELRLLDEILKALPKSAGRGSTVTASGQGSTRRRSTGRRATAPSRAGGPRGKWKPGRPGRPPKWYLEQQAATSGTSPGKRRGRKPSAPRSPRAKRPPSEKQLAALAKARAARAAKRAAGEGTAVTAG